MKSKGDTTIRCLATTIRTERFLNCLESNDETHDEYRSDTECYQFGEYFYYSATMKQDPHFCQPKYETMEQELKQNVLYSISSKQWNATMLYAQSILDEMSNNVYEQQSCFDKFGINFTAKDHPYYNKRYNIKCGQQISLLHLMSVIFYFNHSNLATIIRRTFRAKDKNESYKNIKERHSNFVHLCRNICETITLYGTKLPKHSHVYRGITQQTFASFDAFWGGPLSTTVDINVANRFARSHGSVLKLSDSEDGSGTMYVDASKILSNYSDEKEYLMWAPYLKIIDIPYCGNQRINVQQWISAIRLFQKYIDGHLLSKYEIDELLNEMVQNKLNTLLLSRNKVINNHFVILLFETTLKKLFETRNIMWINPICEMDQGLQQNIIESINKHHTIKYIKQCQVKEWKIETDELCKLLIPCSINNLMSRYQGIDQSIIDKISGKIGEYHGMEDCIQMNKFWKYKIDFENKKYRIIVCMLINRSRDVMTNKFYDVHIVTYKYSSEINQKDNLMLSLDLLSDQLDICLHFCPRKVSMYPQRSHTQIVSTEQIKTLITSQNSISWKIALRYFHESQY